LLFVENCWLYFTGVDKHKRHDHHKNPNSYLSKSAFKLNLPSHFKMHN
jgi:hypothetical protein